MKKRGDWGWGWTVAAMALAAWAVQSWQVREDRLIARDVPKPAPLVRNIVLWCHGFPDLGENGMVILAMTPDNSERLRLETTSDRGWYRCEGAAP